MQIKIWFIIHYYSVVTLYCAVGIDNFKQQNHILHLSINILWHIIRKTTKNVTVDIELLTLDSEVWDENSWMFIYWKVGKTRKYIASVYSKPPEGIWKLLLRVLKVILTPGGPIPTVHSTWFPRCTRRVTHRGLPSNHLMRNLRKQTSSKSTVFRLSIFTFWALSTGAAMWLMHSPGQGGT